MGLFSRLTGSEKALDAAIGGVSRGLDKLIYTKQEKADDARKDTAEFRSVMVEWFKNSQGQNLSRRCIALSVTGTWLLTFLLSSGTHIAALFVDAEGVVTEDKLHEAARLVGENAEMLTGAVMLILAFYFAAPHMGAIVGKAMDKFGGKK